MTDLSGRIDALESQLLFIQQQLLLSVNVDTLGSLNSVWNQSHNAVSNMYYDLSNDVQELQTLYANIVLGSGSQSITGSGLLETFETVSKNLKQYPHSIIYSGSYIDYIRYQISSTEYINKYIGYSGSNISYIYISGSPVLDIDSTKYFYYSGSYITGVTYS